VIEQVVNVAQTTIVQDAWDRGQSLSVHRWAYALADGLVRDLGTNITKHRETASVYQRAIEALV